jgi:hypothetical protein
MFIYNDVQDHSFASIGEYRYFRKKMNGEAGEDVFIIAGDI